MQCTGMQFSPGLAVISANNITRQELSMHYRRICAYMGCKLIGSTVFSPNGDVFASGDRDRTVRF